MLGRTRCPAQRLLDFVLEAVVRLREEGDLPVVAPLDEVLGQPGKAESGPPRHFGWMSLVNLIILINAYPY